MQEIQQSKELNRTLQINITKEFQFQCLLIDSNDQEEIIQLRQNEDFYFPLIKFNNYQIEICPSQNAEINQMNIIKDLINQPYNYKLYQIKYQQKQYEITFEVLFALIIDHFKQIIEKKYIIDETIVTVPTRDYEAIRRIEIALKSIHLKNIEINPIIFDYYDQNENLQEIQQKKIVYEKNERMFNKAKLLATEKQEKDQLENAKESILIHEEFEETTMKLNIQQRSKFNFCRLDNYCVFIASRYLESISDHINLMRVSRRMRGNMEKFHYNPIPVNQQNFILFPNLETLHRYSDQEDYIVGGRIVQYVDWVRNNLSTMKTIQELNKTKPIEFKKIYCCSKDFKNVESEIIKIPEGVKEIEKECFNNCYHRNYEVHIPSSITKFDEDCFKSENIKEILFDTNIKDIPRDCLKNCCGLKRIKLPLNETRVIYGNKLYNNQAHFDISIDLPKHVTKINDYEVEQLTSFTIPTFVTSIDDKCSFYWNYKLKELIILEYNDFILNTSFLTKLISLTNISIPLTETHVIYGNKIYNNQSHLKQEIYLPNSIKTINENEVEELSSFIIPSNVTSIDNNCFKYCNALKELIFPESLKVLDNEIFETIKCVTKLHFPTSFKFFNTFDLRKLLLLEELTISTDFKLYGNRLFIEINGCLYSVILPESMKKLNNEEIKLQQIENYIIPQNVTKLSDYCFANCDELTEIKGLEQIKEFGQGCFYQCNKLLQQEEKYQTVGKINEEYINQILNENEKKQIEKWTTHICKNILFDSDCDDWRIMKSTFENRINQKERIVFMIETTENEKYGYYINNEIVVNRYNSFDMSVDEKSFNFQLISKDGIFNPIQYQQQKDKNINYKIHENSSPNLITIDNIWLMKENMKQQSFKRYREENDNEDKVYIFNPKRILVIQMDLTEQQKQQ